MARTVEFPLVAHLRGGFGRAAPKKGSLRAPRARRSHKTRSALIHVYIYASLETHPRRKEKKKKKGKRERVAHNGSVPIPPPRLYPGLTAFPSSSSPSFLFYTVRPTLRARVCHWEFPKYISPRVSYCRPKNGRNFIVFLHLFLRFHKRREGGSCFGPLSLYDGVRVALLCRVVPHEARLEIARAITA